MTPSFDVLRSRDALLALRDEWQTLWATSHGDYYLMFESCLRSWDTTHAPRGRRLCCAVRRDAAGRLVAVLPMQTHRKGLWTIAGTLGPEAAEGCDVLLAADAPPDLAAQILRDLMREVRPDIINLPFVRGGNALDVSVRGLAAFRAVAHQDTMPYALLRGETDWAGYERSLSRSYQGQTARKRRRMQEAGTLTFELIEGSADASIDWLLDEKAKWGVRVAKRGDWLFSPAYRAYLKHYAASSERVLTFVLRLDGVPAAVKVIVAGATLCTLIIAAYDEELSRFSPGNILDEYWVKHVFEHYRDPAGRHLDICFGTGVERYKLHWGRGATFSATTHKIAVTRWGEAPYRLKAAARALKGLRPPRRSRDADVPVGEAATP